MSGMRVWAAWKIALAAAMAMCAVLLMASEARAGKYAVAQCGWGIGADADWADTTGGAKFRQDAWCVPPPGADPFDGVHVKSLTRDGQGTVSGTRFARWRWLAPPGTWITAVRGTWWHALHDGMEQRLGAATSGGFSPFAVAATTDTALRDFSVGFGAPVAAFEDRLLCARAESKWCSLDAGSWSGLRALTITLEDDNLPDVGIGGDLMGGGWRRGNQDVAIWSADLGAGLRFAESFLDGTRIGVTEFDCAKASVGGEWRATVMAPCPGDAWARQGVNTAAFSDGPHQALACSADFAGNRRCTSVYTVRIDNNPPAHPRSPSLVGEIGWRRTNDFDVAWVNPDQGAASPIAGASWRLSGPAGFDSGVRFAGGRDRHSLLDLTVPAAGAYTLQLWLRDEAGNETSSSAVTLPLLLDDVKPHVAFATDVPEGQLRAEVEDEHSGPAAGQLFYRRVDSENWTELPAKLVPADAEDKAHLIAPLPDLGFGTWVFRADTADAAGNGASTTLRSDGTQMAIHRVPPPHVPQAKTRLFARLRGGHGRGDALTIPFGAPAVLSGRLLLADGAPVAGREIRVVARPSRGALAAAAVQTVATGDSGGFELPLLAGPSRRVTVSFLGTETLEPARRPGLELRVRSGVTLRAAPAALRTGQILRLSGRVARRGAPIPRRGKLVAIQYLEAATHRWRPVLVTRSDHDGRFRARYRFRYVSGRAAIRLRATVLPEERWPYAPGSSAPVTVRVTSPTRTSGTGHLDR
jgi:hypothetical protein